MREIKLRYIFKRKSDDHIYQIIVPIEVLEDGYGEIFSMLENWEWELIDRNRATGLPDKNGQEIYEGDICRHLKTSEVASVSWNCCGFYQFGSRLIAEYAGMFEIIGNIYKDPEKK